MSRTTETALVPEVEARPRMSLLRPEVIEDAVIVSEEGHHPNFIEANTSGITLKELTKKNIIPTFSDNSLTISHQNFIGAVTKAAGEVFGELTSVECRVSHPIGAVTKAAGEVFGELTSVECRVSHPIIGRIPSAQNKKASELTEEEKTVFYQRLAWVCHIKNLVRTING